MDQCVWYPINKAPIIRKQCSIIENIIEHCSCLCEYIILEQNIVNHREKKSSLLLSAAKTLFF
jgi:hypothetical protein